MAWVAAPVRFSSRLEIWLLHKHKRAFLVKQARRSRGGLPKVSHDAAFSCSFAIELSPVFLIISLQICGLIPR